MAFFISGRDVFVSAPVVKRNLSANDEPASFVNHAALQSVRLLRRQRRSEVNCCEKEQRQYHVNSPTLGILKNGLSRGAYCADGVFLLKNNPNSTLLCGLRRNQ